MLKINIEHIKGEYVVSVWDDETDETHIWKRIYKDIEVTYPHSLVTPGKYIHTFGIAE